MIKTGTQIIGLKELRAAVMRNPQRVKFYTDEFLVQGMAVYRRIIQNNPWRLNQSGGGVPVDTKNLKQSHAVRIGNMTATIGPGVNYPVKYSYYVHEGTRRMKARPWLDYAKEKGHPEIVRLSRELLKNIVHDLAK